MAAQVGRFSKRRIEARDTVAATHALIAICMYQPRQTPRRLR